MMDWRSARVRRHAAAVGLIALLSACSAGGGSGVTIGHDRIVVPPNADLSGQHPPCAHLVIETVGLAIRAAPVIAAPGKAPLVCVYHTSSTGDSPRL